MLAQGCQAAGKPNCVVFQKECSFTTSVKVPVSQKWGWGQISSAPCLQGHLVFVGEKPRTLRVIRSHSVDSEIWINCGANTEGSLTLAGAIKEVSTERKHLNSALEEQELLRKT